MHLILGGVSTKNLNLAYMYFIELQLNLGNRVKRCLSEGPACKSFFSPAEDALKRRVTQPRAPLSALPTAVYWTLVLCV